jgi:hypothetical protein
MPSIATKFQYVNSPFYFFLLTICFGPYRHLQVSYTIDVQGLFLLQRIRCTYTTWRIVYLTWRWPVEAETCSEQEEIKGTVDVLKLCCDWRHHRKPSWIDAQQDAIPKGKKAKNLLIPEILTGPCTRTRRFEIANTKAYHWTLLWANSISFTYPQTNFLKQYWSYPFNWLATF